MLNIIIIGVIVLVIWGHFTQKRMAREEAIKKLKRKMDEEQEEPNDD